MKKFALIASMALSNFAHGYSPFSTLVVENLPARYSVSCSIEDAKLVERDGKLQINLFEEAEGYAGLTLTHRLRLKGKFANDVRSVKLELTQPGWFPKCSLILR